MSRPLVPPHIDAIRPYVPGKPIEAAVREYGVRELVKLASNENPLGPSPRALEAMARALRDVHLYPDSSIHGLRHALAERHGVSPDQIVVGNGSNELIEIAIRTFVGPGEDAVLSAGSFIMYEVALRAAGVPFREVPLRDHRYDLDAMAEAVGPRTRIVFIANPDNPNGTWVTRAELERFLARVPPEVVVVLDEAYFEYATAGDYPDGTRYLAGRPSLIVLRTFSKIYGLAGIRLGYGFAEARRVEYMNRVREPFNANSVAQAAGLAALEDSGHVERSRALAREGIARLSRELPALGIRVWPSQANFVFCDLGRPTDPLFPELIREGVIVRPMRGWGFPTCARITVGTPEQNDRLLAALRRVLARAPAAATGA